MQSREYHWRVELVSLTDEVGFEAQLNRVIDKINRDDTKELGHIHYDTTAIVDEIFHSAVVMYKEEINVY